MCHEMSCDVMRCRGLHAPGAYPAVPSDMKAAISGRCFGYSAQVLRLCIFGIGISFPPCFVPHSPPPAWRSGGTLIRAYPARAPAPVAARFAPARFARLIARMRLRARAGRRAHLARWPNRGLFRAGANGETKRTRGCCFLPAPNIAYDSDLSIIIEDLLLNTHERFIVAGRPGASNSRKRRDMRADAFFQRIEVVTAFEHGRESAADMARSIRTAEKRRIDLPDDCQGQEHRAGNRHISGKSLSR